MKKAATATKTQKQFEAWALEQVEKLQMVLLLQDHTPLGLVHGCRNKGAAAEFEFCYPYKTLTVRYGDRMLDMWANGAKAELLRILTHEMCHAVTDPFYAKATNQWRSKDEIEDERERLTDHIANIVIKSGLVELGQ